MKERKMFAVIKTGGKQYKVTSGDVLRVEKLAANAGDTVQFNDVLMVGDVIGAPLVEGAGVQATVIDQIKGEKVINFVRRRRKHSSKRTKGHRQKLTLVRVTEILATGADKSGVMAAVGRAPAVAAPAAVAPAEAAAPAKKAPAKKPAAKKAAAAPAAETKE
jgi:large subunit ribosomal protein L21